MDDIITEKPKFPQYAFTQKRQDSFKAWLPYLPIKSETLVKSGCVYTGVGDSVRCFYCGGGLRNFEDGGNPDVEHILWYPHCPFMNLKFDREYIDRIHKGKKSQPKEIFKRHEDPMTHSTVLSCIQSGFNENMVKITINLFYKQYNHMNFDSDAFVEMLLNLEESLSNGETSICEENISLPFSNRPETVNPEQESQPFSCSICKEGVSNLIRFSPCGHKSTCYMCSVSVQKCPVCCEFIKGRIRPKFE